MTTQKVKLVLTVEVEVDTGDAGVSPLHAALIGISEAHDRLTACSRHCSTRNPIVAVECLSARVVDPCIDS